MGSEAISIVSSLELCIPARSCFDGAQHERVLCAASLSVRPEPFGSAQDRLVEGGNHDNTAHSFKVDPPVRTHLTHLQERSSV